MKKIQEERLTPAAMRFKIYHNLFTFVGELFHLTDAEMSDLESLNTEQLLSLVDKADKILAQCSSS